MAGHADQDLPDNSLVLCGILADAQYPRGSVQPSAMERSAPTRRGTSWTERLTDQVPRRRGLRRVLGKCPDRTSLAFSSLPCKAPKRDDFFDALDEATR